MTTYHIPAEPLQDACRQLFAAAGSPTSEAGRMAEQLVEANLAGHDSHGVIRVTLYLEEVRKGYIQVGQQNSVLRDTGATVLLSGNWGYGQIAATRATEMVIERARQHHVACVGITDLFHVGRLADYAVMCAEAGMIGMVFTSGGGYLGPTAPFGGAERRMGTNPIAMAFPSDREEPVVFDMATSALAEGKFKVARDAGKPMPEGVLLNKAGRPSTDPNDLYEGGAILPLGAAQGYKGYLLNFMVEVMAGILTGGGYMGHHKREGLNNCTTLLVLDVAAFRELTDFKGELNAFIGYLKESSTMPDQEVLAPGEVEARRMAERRREGIPIAEETVKALQAELDRYEVAVQLTALAAEPRPA